MSSARRRWLTFLTSLSALSFTARQIFALLAGSCTCLDEGEVFLSSPLLQTLPSCVRILDSCYSSKEFAPILAALGIFAISVDAAAEVILARFRGYRVASYALFDAELFWSLRTSSRLSEDEEQAVVMSRADAIKAIVFFEEHRGAWMGENPSKTKCLEALRAALLLPVTVREWIVFRDSVTKIRMMKLLSLPRSVTRRSAVCSSEMRSSMCMRSCSRV